MQRVLKLRLALTSADGEVLGGLHEERRARHHCQFAAQPANHLVGADLPFSERLQGDEHAALVRRSVAAGKAHNGFDRRVFHDDADELRHLVLHGGERNILGGLHRTLQAAGILLREKALGDDDVEINAQRRRRNRDQQSQRLVAKNQLQAAAVEA